MLTTIFVIVLGPITIMFHCYP